jgi:glycosyltransferase involved in cell wall biosynthesis
MKKTIFFLSISHPMFGLGGAEIQTYKYAKSFSKKGWDVFFVSPIKGEVKGEFDNNGIKLLLYNKSASTLIDTIKIINYIFKYKPKVLFYRDVKYQYGLLVFFSKWVFKTTCIWSTMSDKLCTKKCSTITLRNKINEYSFLKTFFKNIKYSIQDKIFSYGVKHSTLVMTQNNYQFQNILSEFSRKSFTIYNNTFIKKNRNNLKEDIVLFVSTLRSYKKPDLFCKLSNHDKFGAKFIMIGENYKDSHSANLFNQSLKDSNVSYLGSQSHNVTESFIQKSKILINTSSFEGFPNTFVQAWANGVPVISLKVDPDNIIKKNSLGFCCYDDFDLMIKYTNELIKDQKLWEEISENCYNFSRTFLDTDVNSDKIISKILS